MKRVPDFNIEVNASTVRISLADLDISWPCTCGAKHAGRLGRITSGMVLLRGPCGQTLRLDPVFKLRGYLVTELTADEERAAVPFGYAG